MAGLVPLRFFLLSPRKPLRWVFAGAPLVLPKKMGRARWKKKPLGPNLPVRASLGMRTADSQLSASLPSSIQVRCNAPRHPRLCRKLRRNISFQGACQCVQLLFPLPLRGGVSKEGAAAPSLCRLKGRFGGGKSAKRRLRRMKRADFRGSGTIGGPNRGRESYRRNGGPRPKSPSRRVFWTVHGPPR